MHVVNHRMGEKSFALHSRFCSMGRRGRFERGMNVGISETGGMCACCAPAVCIFRKLASSLVFLEYCLRLGTIPRYL